MKTKKSRKKLKVNLKKKYFIFFTNFFFSNVFMSFKVKIPVDLEGQFPKEVRYFTPFFNIGFLPAKISGESITRRQRGITFNNFNLAITIQLPFQNPNQTED